MAWTKVLERLTEKESEKLLRLEEIYKEEL